MLTAAAVIGGGRILSYLPERLLRAIGSLAGELAYRGSPSRRE